MKAKTTKREINSRFSNILNVDADEMNSLLYFTPAFAYSTRAEGWACDYYEIGNFCLSSGYSPIGKHASRDLQKSFDIKAKKVMQSTFFKTETKRKKVLDLLLQFAEQANNN